MRGNKESLSQEKGGEGKAASSLVVTATSSLGAKIVWQWMTL
jgi:hypothetical protein